MKKTMRQIIAVLGLLFLFVPAVAPQGKSKPWLRGTWEGTGYQTDTDSTWLMRLTIRKVRDQRHRFTIDYPSLHCGGVWKLLSINQGRATFREQIERGQDECTDAGLVQIKRMASGQLVYLYSRPGSREITASAILNRKRPAAKQ